MTYAVIMAGGVGSRFWPASTQQYPKQFLSLFSDNSLLQETVDRIRPLIPPERVYIITNQDYVPLVKEHVPDVPESQIVGEPVAKNTAPCIAAAARLIHDRDPEATMVVLPADHYIKQPEQFCGTLETAIKKAEEGDFLVTIGIEPSHPETGYGYIHFYGNQESLINKRSVYSVKTFTEKPNRETAIKFLETGAYLWNSGMFIWKTKTVLSEIKKQLPEMAELSRGISHKKPERLDRFYLNCQSISIDYGIMEHAENVFVVPGSFGWNDVGSWKAVYELLDKNRDGNVATNTHAYFESSGDNMIFSKTDKMVAMVGLDNVAYVETDDAILLVNLNEAQKVKHLVNKLKKDIKTKKYT